MDVTKAGLDVERKIRGVTLGVLFPSSFIFDGARCLNETGDSDQGPGAGFVRMDKAGSDFNGPFGDQLGAKTLGLRGFKLVPWRCGSFDLTMSEFFAINPTEAVQIGTSRRTLDLPANKKHFLIGANTTITCVYASTASEAPDGGDGLSPGIISGIVIGGLVALALVAGGVFLLVRRQKKSNRDNSFAENPIVDSPDLRYGESQPGD